MADNGDHPSPPKYHDSWDGSLEARNEAYARILDIFEGFLKKRHPGQAVDTALAVCNSDDVADFYKHILNQEMEKVEREEPSLQLATIKTYPYALKSYASASPGKADHLEARDSAAVRQYAHLEAFVKENVEGPLERAKSKFVQLGMPKDLAKDVARIPRSRQALEEIIDEKGLRDPSEKILELGNAFKRPASTSHPPLPTSTRKKLGLMVLEGKLPGACAWEAEWYFQSLGNSEPDAEILQSSKAWEAIAKAATAAARTKQKAIDRLQGETQRQSQQVNQLSEQIKQQSEVIHQKDEEVQRLKTQLEDATSRMLANMRI